MANPAYVVSAAENNTIVLWNIETNITSSFSIKALGATFLACCPHDEKTVAVGSKTGLVYILNLSQKNQILYKLRGHDNEVQCLAWCPVPLNIFWTGSSQTEWLLASGSRDKDIYIWRAGTDGRCEATLALPTGAMSHREDHYRAKSPGINFTPLCWLTSHILYSSNSFGDLISCDLKAIAQDQSCSKTTGKKTNASKSFWKLVHSRHIRGLFAIRGMRLDSEKVDEKVQHQEKSATTVEKEDDKAEEHIQTKSVSPGLVQNVAQNWRVNSEASEVLVRNSFLLTILILTTYKIADEVPQKYFSLTPKISTVHEGAFTFF